MTVPEFIYSPSQIEAWRDCSRKWAFDKIDRVPKEATAAAKLGDAVHKQLERYLAGQSFDFASDHHAASLAQHAAEHLPAPTGFYSLEIESTISMDSPYGHGWTGRIDWLSVAPDGRVTIGDHKTTSDIAKWAKSTAVLYTDTQAIVYSEWAFRRWPKIQSLDLQWTYVQTRGRMVSEPRRLTMYREHVADRFIELDSIANDITLARRQHEKALDFPHNPDSCDKYGGCPYRSKCNLSPLQALRIIMSNNNFPAPPPPGQSLFDQMQNLAAQGDAPQAPAAFAPPPAYAPPPAPTPPAPPTAAGPEDLSRIATKNAEGKITHSLQGKPLPPTVVATQWVSTGQGGYLPLVPLTHQVAELLERAANEYAANPQAFAQPAPAPAPNPGFAPPGMVAPPPAAAAAPPPPAFAPPAVTGPINPPEWQPPPAPQAPQAAAPPAPQAAAPPAPQAAEAPKRRGRPPKNRTAAPDGPGSPAPVVEASGTWPIGTLYVDCSPDDTDGIHSADEIVRQAAEQIRQASNGVDWSMMDFGKGQGALALYVEQAVNGMGGNVSIMLDTRSREGAILLSRLAGMSATVIRGR